MNRLKRFLESNLFMVLLAVYIAISWYFNIKWITFSVISIIFTLVFITKAKLYNIVLIILMVFTSNRNDGYDVNDPTLAIFICATTPAVVLAIYRLSEALRKRPSWHLIALSILNVALFLSVIPSEHKGMSIGHSFIFFVSVVFGFTSTALIEDSTKARDKITFSCTLIPFILLIEYLGIYHDLGTIEEFFKKVNDKIHLLGYINLNHLAALEFIGLAMSIYSIANAKKFIAKIYYLIPLILSLGLIVMSCSRAGYLATLIAAVLTLFILLVTRKIKVLDLLMIVTITAATIFTILHFFDKYESFDFLSKILDKGDNLSGRDKVWAVAMEQFKLHPILGTGIGTSKYCLDATGDKSLNWLYNYHNYIAQASTCGIVGLSAFTVYLMAVNTRIIKNDRYSLCMLGILIYYLIHGFYDTIFFNRLLMPVFVVLVEVSMIRRKRNAACMESPQLDMVVA